MAIPAVPFGRTGHQSTRVIFGGAALSQVTQDVADHTLEVLLRFGINHLDLASSYGDAELRVRPWLREHPNQFFLATKTDGRTAPAAREELQRSLDRMGVDHVDLWQLHSLADPIEWDTALSPGGAIEAALDARRQGLVRWIGITGHGTQIAALIRRSLDRFDFDSVLLPYNYVTMQLAYYRENFEAVIEIARRRQVAVQTIKSIAFQPWLGRPRTRATWYEPLEAQEDIDLAVWWALASKIEQKEPSRAVGTRCRLLFDFACGREGVFLNSVGDVDLLPKMLDAAGRFESAPDDAAMQALVERVRPQPIFV